MNGPIIFPTDFSTASDAALEFATELAKARGVQLLIVHVEEPPFAYHGGEYYYGMLDPDVTALQTMLRDLKPSDPTVPFENRLLVGSPANAIVEVAKDTDASMIVMGSHGRRGLVRVLMGSVAEVVVRHAPCPVIIVKDPRRFNKENKTPRGTAKV